MKKLAVHFGGGALGRGLVVPLLEQSEFEVVLVDVDEQLITALKNKGGYPIYVTDEALDNQHLFITIKDAISSREETEKLKRYLNEAEIITTAVRRENLIHVVNCLIDSLDGTSKKTVICAENIENVSRYFAKLLDKAVKTKEQQKAARCLIVPDTIVDRICSSEWPKSLQINTEKFHELAVDKSVVSKTDIKQIPAVADIEAAFARKRLMVNTFADASSFMALAEGKTYLHEAILDPDIQAQLAPYFDSFKVLLEKKYGYSAQELNAWQRLYEKRLSNSQIKRELHSVARNLWEKMTLQERFVWPLMALLELGVNIEDGVAVLISLILKSSNESEETVKEKLAKLWNQDLKGKELYQMAQKYLQE